MLILLTNPQTLLLPGEFNKAAPDTIWLVIIGDKIKFNNERILEFMGKADSLDILRNS
jgi:hypothetical protein